MSEKKKIVMIDDEEDLCFFVKSNLEHTQDYEVATTSNAEEAEDFCRKENPNIILIDNVMPGKSGVEIAKSIRGHEDTKDIPIIMISGKGEIVYSKKKGDFKWQPQATKGKETEDISDEKDAESLSRAYGVDDYIEKPFTTEILVQVINEVLEKKRKESEKEE